MQVGLEREARVEPVRVVVDERLRDWAMKFEPEQVADQVRRSRDRRRTGCAGRSRTRSRRPRSSARGRRLGPRARRPASRSRRAPAACSAALRPASPAPRMTSWRSLTARSAGSSQAMEGIRSPSSARSVRRHERRASTSRTWFAIVVAANQTSSGHDRHQHPRVRRERAWSPKAADREERERRELGRERRSRAQGRERRATAKTAEQERVGKREEERRQALAACSCRARRRACARH